jgi:hypothetical protein
MKNPALCLASVALMLLSACSVFNTISEKEKDRADITAAIQKYLQERGAADLNAMTWEIREFSQDRDRATVQVMFIAKADQQAQMPVTYELQRVNGVWTVQKPASGGGHPGLNPPAKSAPDAGGQLPPGHPPVGDAPVKAQPPKKQ